MRLEVSHLQNEVEGAVVPLLPIVEEPHHGVHASMDVAHCRERDQSSR
jgi:hypothetical protein